jgi:multidrug transporter EmrE-like cation transporter
MKKLKISHAAVLAIWAGLNVVIGGTLMFISADEQLLYFYIMNVCWGLVNLGIAWFIYAHHNEVFNQPQTLLQQMNHQRHAEKAILFNIGLDMAFIASGFALQQHGYAPKLAYSALWKGFGTAIILQGAFLLVQDTIFYRLHLKNRRKVYPLWQQRTLGR